MTFDLNDPASLRNSIAFGIGGDVKETAVYLLNGSSYPPLTAYCAQPYFSMELQQCLISHEIRGTHDLLSL